jgi:CBS domain-containing protein
MSIGRIANRVVATAGELETIVDAARRMAGTNVGCVVVVRDGKPVGILTDRDIAVRAVAKEMDPLDTTIAAIMTPEPDTVDESAPVEDALERMAEAGVRRLAVTAQGGSLLGIVTMDDIVASLVDQARDIDRVLRTSRPNVTVHA